MTKAATPAVVEPAGPPLDATPLLSVDELRAATQYAGELTTEKLTDLPTTPTYDSVHFKATGKPETFDFLGFTHLCATTKSGRFWVRRITIKKRMRAKLREVKEELKRRRHEPIPMQGQWLRSVVHGHLAYFAVPGNTDAVATFRTQIGRHWYKALRRRSQRHRVTWERMGRLEARWLPPARITHPWPNVRFDARTQGRSPVR